MITETLRKLTTDTTAKINKTILHDFGPKAQNTDFYVKRRFVHRLVRQIYGREGLESAKRLRIAFSGDMQTVSTLTDDELRIFFSEVETFDWAKDFNVTAGDFLLGSNICGSIEELNEEFRIAEEIEARRIMFNNIVISSPYQVTTQFTTYTDDTSKKALQKYCQGANFVG